MPTGALEKSRIQQTRVVDSRSALTKTMSRMAFAFVYSLNEFGWELNAAVTKLGTVAKGALTPQACRKTVASGRAAVPIHR